MIILFVVLAYTGFVHKFPDAMWSKPFNVFQDPNYMRGLVHRVAGWAFVALIVFHLVALFCSKRGRDYLKVLWVARHDLTDMLTLLRYNLGLGGNRPPHRKFNYIEKAEYWALIWGSVVMIVTGIMLVFTETVLRLWPKVWHDAAMVIHFYEAVLATLAIVVWHFYWVIFDPAEYPMNPAWLIGKKASHKPDASTSTGSQEKEPPSHEPPHTD
jgi:cytochrome b subunit of formate dehydrogenase